MVEMADEDFAKLAERLTDPDVPLPAPTAVLTGAAAAADGRDFLIREYGSESVLEAALRRAGRKRLGEEAKGASPSVPARLPERDFAELKQLEAQTCTTQSELVREAVSLLVDQHRRSA